MNLPVLLLLALLLLALWLLVRLRRGNTSESRPPPAAHSSVDAEYHAVSIKITGIACAAARELTGQRFLSNEAPRLPLPGCTAADCNCRFVHHKDRRSGKDRRSPFSPGGLGGGTGNFQTDQRQGNDRRRTDDEDYF